MVLLTKEVKDGYLMASPCKPWERNTGLNQRHPNYIPEPSVSFVPSSPHVVPEVVGGGGGSRRLPSPVQPPLPPRGTTSSYSNYSWPAYGAYGSYGNTGHFGGPYYGNGYGAYGGPYGSYNRFGQMGGLEPDDNAFIKFAEESSRPAFQSLESIVHAFGSVSMMLESSYHAVYSSFSAVLRVAEHFSRMKSHFAQIFSALAVVRSLRWLYRKLLYLIGLRSQDQSFEAAWHTGVVSPSDATSFTEADIKASKSSWPVVMFVALVFGGPYLIWRLLSSLVPPAKTKNLTWMKGQGVHYAAIAEYSFQARTRHDLSFSAGQSLFLAPKDQQPNYRGWLLASNGTNYGLVPANHIKILGLRSGSSQPISKQQTQGGAASSCPESRGLGARIVNIPSPKFAPNNQSATQDIQQAQSVPQLGYKPSVVDQQSQEIHNQLPTQSSLASLQSLDDRQVLSVVPEEKEGHDQSSC